VNISSRDCWWTFVRISVRFRMLSIRFKVHLSDSSTQHLIIKPVFDPTLVSTYTTGARNVVVNLISNFLLQKLVYQMVCKGCNRYDTLCVSWRILQICMAKNQICCISLQIKAYWSDSFFLLGFRYVADTVSVSELVCSTFWP
jgi:hypothetical protein